MTDIWSNPAIEDVLARAWRTQGFRDRQIELWVEVFAVRGDPKDIATLHIACAAKVVEDIDGSAWLVEFLRTCATAIETGNREKRKTTN